MVVTLDVWPRSPILRSYGSLRHEHRVADHATRLPCREVWEEGAADARALRGRGLGGSRRPAAGAPSTAPPTGRWWARSTRPPPPTPSGRSPRRTAPSTRAPGRPRRRASAATCCCARPTCSSATPRPWPSPSRRTPASAWSRAGTTWPTWWRCFRYYGRVAAEDAGRVVDTGNPDVVSRIVHEPVGVCGLIAPWNYPLLQASWKVAPCLAAGNTFVLKPSELTPHTSIHLMRLLERGRAPGRRRQPRARRRPRRGCARWPPTPASTSSRSPAACRPAAGSWPRPPRP